VEDRQGLLAKVVSSVAEEGANIKSVDARTYEGAEATIGMVVEVRDSQHMQKVIGRLRRISGVRDVQRLRS
jgi:GTP pyrophosphokinase